VDITSIRVQRVSVRLDDVDMRVPAAKSGQTQESGSVEQKKLYHALSGTVKPVPDVPDTILASQYSF
jgi:hypothetical protein